MSYVAVFLLSGCRCKPFVGECVRVASGRLAVGVFWQAKPLLRFGLMHVIRQVSGPLEPLVPECQTADDDLADSKNGSMDDDPRGIESISDYEGGDREEQSSTTPSPVSMTALRLPPSCPDNQTLIFHVAHEIAGCRSLQEACALTSTVPSLSISAVTSSQTSISAKLQNIDPLSPHAPPPRTAAQILSTKTT